MNTKFAIPHPLLIGLTGATVLLGCSVVWLTEGREHRSTENVAETKGALRSISNGGGRAEYLEGDRIKGGEPSRTKGSLAVRESSGKMTRSADQSADVKYTPPGTSRTAEKKPTPKEAARTGVNVLGTPAENPTFEPSQMQAAADAPSLKVSPELLTPDEMALVEEHIAFIAEDNQLLAQNQTGEQGHSNSQGTPSENTPNPSKSVKGRTPSYQVDPETRRARLERELLAAAIGEKAVQSFEQTRATEDNTANRQSR